MNFTTFVLPDPHQLKTGSEDDVFSKSGKKNGHSVKEETPFFCVNFYKKHTVCIEIFLPYGHKFVTEIFDPLSFFLKINNSESY